MNIKNLTTLLFIILSFSLLSCTKQPDNKTTKNSAKHSSKNSSANSKSNTIFFHLSDNPSLLNPILSTDVISSAVEDLVFNGLFKINESLELVPDLVATYSVKEGNTSYDFTLKPNITWHDGTPFTAHDVKFTFDAILDPKTNTVRRSSFIIEGEPIKINVKNNLEFNIKIAKPYAPFLTRISMPIIPKHIYENTDINTHPNNHKPIGTGPFTFDQWKTGQFITLKKNENYFGKAPKLDRIFFKIIPDGNTALVALEKQEIDEASIQSKDIKQVQNMEHIDLHIYEKLAYSYVGFNLKKSPFNNKTFRQALSYAINRPALVKSILKGYGKPVYVPASPISWAFPKDPITFDYNPEKAKQMLASIGYTWNEKDKLFYDSGKPVSFTLMTSKGSESAEKTAQIIQQYLKQVGITMTINLMEWKSMQDKTSANIEPRPFDATLQGWSLAIDPDSYSIWHSSQYPVGFNYGGYNNPRVDELLVKGRLELDQTKRADIYGETFNLIGNDCPYLFLFSSTSKSAVNKRVKGLSEPGPAGIFVNIEDIWVSEK